MTLEELLRDCKLYNGRIQLSAHRGQWTAVVAHFDGGHMTSMVGQDEWRDDPVEALQIVLIEDARKTADVVRRYNLSPKLGDAVQDDEFGSLFE